MLPRMKLGENACREVSVLLKTVCRAVEEGAPSELSSAVSAARRHLRATSASHLSLVWDDSVCKLHPGMLTKGPERF